MKDDDQKRLSLLLAFQSMVCGGKKIEEPGTVERIIELGRRMDEFCAGYMGQAFPRTSLKFAEDPTAEEIDLELEGHLEDLKSGKGASLPEDKEKLILFHDRLQQRKSRRMQWKFYVGAKPEKLKDQILRYLDEELEDLAADSGDVASAGS